jgi:IstB-like ATP binding protein
MKAPRIAACAASVAKRAEAEGWDHQTYLAAVRAEEVGSRETHGGQHRVKAARFPQVKTLDDFDFGFQRSVKQQTISHLAQLDFLHEANNVVFLGPPGTGKTHLSIALGVQAARRGHRVAFASAQDRVSRLAGAKRAGKLEEELERLRRIPLVIVDEVGYIPLRPRRRRPVLLVDLEPLRAGQPDRQLQQELLGMGRDLWRRHRRRGPGRPPGAPRRGRRPAGRELPAQRPSQGGDAQELTLTAQISTGDSRADFDRR